MPTPSSSRRSSKSGPSVNEAHRSNERREKAKSSQSYAGYSASRRGSVKPPDENISSVPERPRLKSRTNSAPLVGVRKAGQEPGTGDSLDDGDVREQTEHDRGRSAPQALGGAVDGGQDEDEVAGVVGAVRHFRPFGSPVVSEPSLPEINIAVIGAEGVGKSTFVQNALDLPYPAPSAAAERKIPIDGSVYLVRLLELPIDDVDIDDDDTVSWPDTIENKMMPKVDGALTLYNVKDKGSFEDIPDMLNAISKAALPSMLISCKCDGPPRERQLDPLIIEQKAKQSVSDLATLQTSVTAPETHKRGISMILKAIIFGHSEDGLHGSSMNRRRAQSSAVRPVSPRPPNSQHARANSEFTGSQKHTRHDSSLAAYGSSDHLKVPRKASEDAGAMQSSFLFEESGTESSYESPRSSVSAEIAANNNAFPPTGPPPISSLSENGATFDELVDRLLAQPTSKADSKFAAIFLALYRKFAAPGRLLEAIVERFDKLDRNGLAPMIKTVAQLRYLHIMEQWISHYPGDFAFPKTKRRMRTFVAKLTQTRIFTAASKEMSGDLEVVQEDDDTNWAYSDKDREASNENDRWTMSSTASTLIDDASFGFSDDSSGVTMRDDASVAATVGNDTIRSASSSTTSSQIMINVEAAQRQAQLLAPNPRQPITKIQWRALMEFNDDLIARELTRMDWIMFSSIRPRDLIRQVTLKEEQKASCRNLVNVNRMIEHFNQLACWVANYILLRDKPKHRALMLEKFMRVARKLRELNNYNALGAIIAGIKSSSVHRLQATRELIPPSVGKDWSRLEILMSPAKSHAPYRLAWENSSSERIPYLPLHRRDLVSASEGNKTFVGDDKDGKINWKKFEIMGEVIVGMQRAQGLPYKGLGGSRGNEQIKELVLDVKLVKDEEDLYERSLQLEAAGNAGSTSSRVRSFFNR